MISAQAGVSINLDVCQRERNTVLICFYDW